MGPPPPHGVGGSANADWHAQWHTPMPADAAFAAAMPPSAGRVVAARIPTHDGRAPRRGAQPRAAAGEGAGAHAAGGPLRSIDEDAKMNDDAASSPTKRQLFDELVMRRRDEQECSDDDDDDDGGARGRRRGGGRAAPANVPPPPPQKRRASRPLPPPFGRLHDDDDYDSEEEEEDGVSPDSVLTCCDGKAATATKATPPSRSPYKAARGMHIAMNSPGKQKRMEEEIARMHRATQRRAARESFGINNTNNSTRFTRAAGPQPAAAASAAAIIPSPVSDAVPTRRPAHQDVEMMDVSSAVSAATPRVREGDPDVPNKPAVSRTASRVEVMLREPRGSPGEMGVAAKLELRFATLGVSVGGGDGGGEGGGEGAGCVTFGARRAFSFTTPPRVRKTREGTTGDEDDDARGRGCRK